MDIQDILDYFLSPKRSGYDVPKTLTYAFIFLIAVYLIFKLLKKTKIKVDRRLAIAVLPFVLLGSTIRVLEDLGMISSYIFVTPGIYFLVFFIFLSILSISIFIERKKGIPYFKIPFVTGFILFSFAFSFLRPSNFYGLLLALVFFVPWPLIFYFIKKWSLTNRIVASVQLFDSTVTFVALNFFGQGVLEDFGFYEQHVVPTFIINLFGPFSFIIVKLIAVVAVLLFIDKISDDKEFNNYLKLIIGILGLATGFRDLLAILVLV